MSPFDPSESQPIAQELLIAYALGELDAAAVQSVESRLARDERAWRQLEKLWTTVQVLKTDDSVEPPKAVVDRAKLIMSAAPVPAAALDWLGHAARRIVASLLFDSQAQPSLAGFRGGLSARQLTYSTPLAEIDLQLSPSSDRDGATRCAVRGQIDRQGASSGEIRVAIIPASGAEVVETTTDQYGAFNLTAPAESFDVMILVEDTIITVPGLRA